MSAIQFMFHKQSAHTQKQTNKKTPPTKPNRLDWKSMPYRTIPKTCDFSHHCALFLSLPIGTLRSEQTTAAITLSCRLCQSRQCSLTLALCPFLREAVPKAPPRSSPPINEQRRQRGACYADEKSEKGDTWLVGRPARGGRQKQTTSDQSGKKRWRGIMGS